MFPSRKYNSEINNSHEKCLRLIDSAKISSHKESLEKDGSISIRYVNIQDLAVEMYGVNDSLPKIFSDLFCQTEITSYNFLRVISCLGPNKLFVWHYQNKLIALELVEKWIPQPYWLCNSRNISYWFFKVVGLIGIRSRIVLSF